MSEPCGFQSFCGRPSGHRGHHGGWRTGITARNPVVRDWFPTAQLGLELTARNLQVIAERIYHGDVGEAAACLGISEQTFRNHLGVVLAKTGAVSTIQLPLVIGWTQIPSGILKAHEAVA